MCCYITSFLTGSFVSQLQGWMKCYSSCPEIGEAIHPEETVHMNMDAKENSGLHRGFASEEELKIEVYTLHIVGYVQSVYKLFIACDFSPVVRPEVTKTHQLVV